MQLKDKEGWYKSLNNNQDPYRKAIHDFAEKWANLMEEEVDNGYSIEDVANKTSHKADTEGITGFMYGAAISILSNCWVYGEELKQWHNLKTQLTGGGEEANKSEAVLNPTVLCVK